MIIRKVCMVGDPGVGKTHLVRSWLGADAGAMPSASPAVSVHRKVASAVGGEVSLVLMDLAGRQARETYPADFLRGCSGYVLVLDPAGLQSVEQAYWLRTRVEAATGPLPFVIALNKQDLTRASAEGQAAAAHLVGGPDWVIPTSAKTGEGVALLFDRLAHRIVLPAAPLRPAQPA